MRTNLVDDVDYCNSIIPQNSRCTDRAIAKIEQDISGLQQTRAAVLSAFDSEMREITRSMEVAQAQSKSLTRTVPLSALMHSKMSTK